MHTPDPPSLSQVSWRRGQRTVTPSSNKGAKLPCVIKVCLPVDWVWHTGVRLRALHSAPDSRSENLGTGRTCFI